MYLCAFHVHICTRIGWKDFQNEKKIENSQSSQTTVSLIPNKSNAFCV